MTDLRSQLKQLGRPSGRADLASLEERLGLLVLVRLLLAAGVLAAAVFAPSEVLLSVSQVLVPSAIYVAVALAAEVLGRRNHRAALASHRLMLPLDAVYLVVMTVPVGGPRSELIMLFFLHLVAVTLLGSGRSGLRIALWDSFLFAMIPSFGLAPTIGKLLGVTAVESPPAGVTALAIMGFWAIALCTAGFSTVSERELRRSRNELEALAVMAAELEKCTDATGAGRVLLAHTTTALGFQRGLLLAPGAAPLLAIAGAAGEAAEVTETAGGRGATDAVVERVRREHRPLALRALDPSDSPVAATILAGARNVVVAAVGTGAEPPVLIFEHGGRLAGQRLARRTLLMVSQFARHGALSLASIALLVERERLATIDGLTGLANRRQFDRTLAREIANAGRRNEPLTLALLDVDHFKLVNDTAGHLAGDEVLRGLGDVLLQACRDMDLVARYGGEEFALILPSCGPEEAMGVLERIGRDLRNDPRTEAITVSGGLATLFTHASDFDSLVSAADAALYESKRAGRDRSTVSSRRAGQAIDVDAVSIDEPTRA